MTITGTNLDTASTATLDFGTGNVATIISDTGSTIVATVPPGTEATTVNVTVTTSSGTSAISVADQFTYESTPAVTSVSPGTGPTGGGTVVTITGTNLAGATAVMFGSTEGVISSDTLTQIVAVSPTGTAGSVNVTVATPVGASAAAQFTYESTPVVVPPVVVAPVLAPIPAQSVKVGQTLELNVGSYAFDPNSPRLPLTYRLVGGTPSGASIDLTTGVLTWSPGENQHIGTYPITVQVSDNGLPSRSVTETFTVNVIDPGPAPKISAAKVRATRGFAIMLKFSEPMNPATVLNPSNYILTEPAKKPKLKKKPTPQPVRIALSVSYNQSTNSVTLRASRMPKTVPALTLTVVGTGPDGIAKLDGLLLAGIGGESGTNYVASVTRKAVIPTVAVKSRTIVERTPARPVQGHAHINADARPIVIKENTSSAHRVRVASTRPAGPMALMGMPAVRGAVHGLILSETGQPSSDRLR